MKTLIINLHFTDYCNYHCHHCFVKKEEKELSFNDIQIIVDKISDYSKANDLKTRINLAGGEPLVSKNIQLIIDYISLKGLEVSIITNGFYLTKEFIEQNKEKVSMIGLSVDSLKTKTNIDIGRCTKNNKVITELNLIELCSAIKNNEIKLKINICASALNISEDFSNFLSKVRPDRIKILRVLGQGGKVPEPYLITDEDWERIKQRYSELKPEFEDNDYMRDGYIIVDSIGNLSKNNLHVTNNSLLKKDLGDCLQNLFKAKEV